MLKPFYRIKYVVILVSVLALNACATSDRSAQYGQSLSSEAQLYADYLSASYASNLGDAPARARYYSRAFARNPEDITLGLKALNAVLNDGQDTLARTLAIEIQSLNPDDGWSRAILGADALSKAKYEKALTYLGGPNAGVGLDDFNALMRGWAQVGLKDEKAAAVSFSDMNGGKYFELMGEMQHAILQMQNGELEQAEKAFTQIDELNLAPVESVLAQARGYMLRKEKDKALAKLLTYADNNGGALTGPIRTYIEAIKADEDLGWELTPAQSASRALTEPAFRYYGAQQQYQAAETFLRIALTLDPKNDKARLFLATILEEEERNPAALKQYAKIGETSAFSVSARLAESDIYFEKGDDAQGIAVLNRINTSHPSRVTQGSLGRAYLIMEDYAKALPYYEAVMAEMSEEELIKNPQIKYIRGICLERIGRWEDAVKDFKFVLKYKPDNADALNYLGYTWADKGVHLTKAFGMIERAVKLEPESGAIIDSLGWAHYKLGRYGMARINLEKAAERSPTSATIIDHLGDVYWKLGRHKEAKYQWERAKDLDPTDKELLQIEGKLKGGLRAATP